MIQCDRWGFDGRALGGSFRSRRSRRCHIRRILVFPDGRVGRRAIHVRIEVGDVVDGRLLVRKHQPAGINADYVGVEGPIAEAGVAGVSVESQ